MKNKCNDLLKLLCIFLLVTPLFLVGCSSGSGSNSVESRPNITSTDPDGATSVDTDALADVLDTYMPPDALSPAEIAGLVFMREEEKLARDVYIAMYALGYPQIFNNIASSEQTHTDAILALLVNYDIPDPVGSNTEGVFVDLDLQQLYDDLIVIGSPSLINALQVGAEIEEIDILDIQRLADEIQGNEEIVIVYESLIKGSRNHLRAFVSNLGKQGVDYQPLHLTQDAYDAIINVAVEN